MNGYNYSRIAYHLIDYHGPHKPNHLELILEKMGCGNAELAVNRAEYMRYLTRRNGHLHCLNHPPTPNAGEES